ncbi:MAG: hypothetical protein ACTHJZ_10460 [Trinickia sp.]|uniref:hypothetical protein n=1 Tax=Trinickia sp. TaxID=2571163 RepID=UPI003F7F7763
MKTQSIDDRLIAVVFLDVRKFDRVLRHRESNVADTKMGPSALHSIASSESVVQGSTKGRVGGSELGVFHLLQARVRRTMIEPNVCG